MLASERPPSEGVQTALQGHCWEPRITTKAHLKGKRLCRQTSAGIVLAYRNFMFHRNQQYLVTSNEDKSQGPSRDMFMLIYKSYTAHQEVKHCFFIVLCGSLWTVFLVPINSH